MTLLAHPALAAVDTTNGAGILCTILLFATVIALVLGLVQVLGLDGGRLGSNAIGGRFGTLIVFVVLLAAYVIFC